MPGEELSKKDLMEHAWRYFALHAAQRMTMFNYFLLVFGLACAGLAGCLREGKLLLPVGMVLGIALAIVAFIFWKLDHRTSFLVKRAEGVLALLENSSCPKEVLLFHDEPSETVSAKALARVWTYGKAFRFAFGLAAVVGVLGAAMSLALYMRSP